MSNRSLIEINHDFTHEIARDPERFVRALVSYLRAGYLDRHLGHHVDSREIIHGVRVFGMRHHSDPYDVRWGGHHEQYGKRGRP